MTDFRTTKRIKDMVASERPQERLERLGAPALSDRELIAMILRSGPPGVDVVSMSGQLLDEAGSLGNLLRWSAEDFMQIRGIGKVKGAPTARSHGLCQTHPPTRTAARSPFDSPQVVARHLQPVAVGESVEHFWVLCLDRKNRLIRRITATTGTATNSLVHAREVFREAIKLSATAIIVAHNHPSGDPAPSRADIQVTRELKKQPRSSVSTCSTTSSSARDQKTLPESASTASTKQVCFKRISFLYLAFERVSPPAHA